MTRTPRGFTLLELLIAIAVFAVVSALAYGGLQAVLTSDSLTRARSTLLAEVQVTLAVLERDLQHVVALETRDRFGDPVPPLRYSPLASEPRLELVRTGGSGGQRLRRVTWRVTEQGLERQLAAVLNPGSEEDVLSRLFLQHQQRGAEIQEIALELRFVPAAGGEGAATDSWPPLRTGPDMRLSLPVLVEIVLEVPGLGAIERHIALPATAHRWSAPVTQ